MSNTANTNTNTNTDDPQSSVVELTRASLESAQWVKQGDRSHPNLQTLDSLTLNYTGWEEDVHEAEESHTGTTTFVRFEQKIWEMEEKQRMHEGNRTHPRLNIVDSLELSYSNWKVDFKCAEEQHVHSRTFNFSRKVEGMQRTQRMFEGDRSHGELVTLDRMKDKLSYEGWKNDWYESEEAHKCLTFQSFDDKLMEMTLKQQIHDGDRSHPRLQALDNLKLSFAGYEEDVASALEQHVCNRSFNFQVKLEGLREKQKIDDGDRTHPNLIILDALCLTYPDWQTDKQEAENAHTGSIWTKFEDMIFQIQQSQNMYDGDWSHPRLVQLESITFTYPGWEEDKTLAQRDHIHSWRASFEKRLTGMREKQRIFGGYFSAYDDSDDSSATNNCSKEDLVNVGDCLICYQRPKTHALFPCGHLCLCHTCAKHDSCVSKCPICRQTSTSLLRVFAPYVSKNVLLGNCVLCAQKPKTHAFVPCGHMSICGDCVPVDTKYPRCPVCTSTGTHVIKLYIG